MICARLDLLLLSIKLFTNYRICICWKFAATLKRIPCTLVEPRMLRDKVLLPELFRYCFDTYVAVLCLTRWSLIYRLLGFVFSAFFSLCGRLSVSSSYPLTSKPVLFFESLDLSVALSCHKSTQIGLTAFHIKCI